jgi:hypothetical protein
MTVRVLRILEYTYETAEHAIRDRQHWAVQDILAPTHAMTIRSCVMSPSFSEDER